MTGALMFLYSLIILISLIIILAILYGNKKHKKNADKTSTDRILAINKIVLGAVVIIFVIGVILVYAYYTGLGH